MARQAEVLQQGLQFSGWIGDYIGFCFHSIFHFLLYFFIHDSVERPLHHPDIINGPGSIFDRQGAHLAIGESSASLYRGLADDSISGHLTA